MKIFNLFEIKLIKKEIINNETYEVIEVPFDNVDEESEQEENIYSNFENNLDGFENVVNEMIDNIKNKTKNSTFMHSGESATYFENSNRYYKADRIYLNIDAENTKYSMTRRYENNNKVNGVSFNSDITVCEHLIETKFNSLEPLHGLFLKYGYIKASESISKI